jgi:hypothetical protein
MLFGMSSPLALLYTDPGTGTLILQLLAAALIGAAFYARQFARRAKSLFSKNKGGEEGLDASSPAASQPGESSSDKSE